MKNEINKENLLELRIEKVEKVERV